ncbi:unnamed protein product [Lupinus luteus]|uniref:TOD1/MUCI70 glycosyltransferase-like domain-containing protein n=1 Tax=Lupinus luteus TaxID=3873 RepID=A0AAV1WAS3_LUPLU
MPRRVSTLLSITNHFRSRSMSGRYHQYAPPTMHCHNPYSSTYFMPTRQGQIPIRLPDLPQATIKHVRIRHIYVLHAQLRRRKSHRSWYTLTFFCPKKYINVPEGAIIIREHTAINNLFSCLWFDEVIDRAELEAMLGSFYRMLYTEETIATPFILSGCFPKLEHFQMNLLNAQVTDDEIRRTVYSIGGFKAQGKYDIQALFYQNHWRIV